MDHFLINGLADLWKISQKSFFLNTKALLFLASIARFLNSLYDIKLNEVWI